MSYEDEARDAERITAEYVAEVQACRERREQALELLACLDQDLMTWALAEVDGGNATDSYQHVLTWLSQHAERDGDVVAEALILARWPRAIKRAKRLSDAVADVDMCLDRDGHACGWPEQRGGVIGWTRSFWRTGKCAECGKPVKR